MSSQKIILESKQESEDGNLSLDDIQFMSKNIPKSTENNDDDEYFDTNDDFENEPQEQLDNEEETLRDSSSYTHVSKSEPKKNNFSLFELSGRNVDNSQNAKQTLDNLIAKRMFICEHELGFNEGEQVFLMGHNDEKFIVKKILYRPHMKAIESKYLIGCKNTKNDRIQWVDANNVFPLILD